MLQIIVPDDFRRVPAIASTQVNSCVIAIFAVLWYNCLLSFDKELRHVWRTPTNVASLLYIFNRYIPMLYGFLGVVIIAKLSSSHVQSCAVVVGLYDLCGALGLIGPAVFTCLRIYALTGTGGSKWLLVVTVILSISSCIIDVATVQYDWSSNLPTPRKCGGYLATDPQTYSIYPILARTCLLLTEVIAAVITWRAAHELIKMSSFREAHGRPSLYRVVVQNGIMYFCVLVSLNLLQIILGILSIKIPGGLETYTILLIDPISSILNSRFLLALRETNERLEMGVSGGESSVSFAVNIAPSSGSEFPEFLTSLAGPVHSFFGDGLEVQAGVADGESPNSVVVEAC